MHDPEITEVDLMAYVDGQLDEPRRLAVESALSRNPSAAADMMGDLARRTALRVATGVLPLRPSPALEALVGSEDRPRQARTVISWRPLAAMAAVIAAGLLLGFGPDAYQVTRMITGTPDYLDDAVQSRDASLIRTAMSSRPKAPWMRPGDIRTAIRIRLPVLPDGWRLVDVQVFPSDLGPSAQLLIDTGDNGQVSLFSSMTRGDETFEPVVVDRFGETMVFWEIQGQSFVMIGDQPRTELRDMAADLSDNQLL